MALFPTPTLNGRLRQGAADSGASLSYQDRRGQIQLGDGYTLSYSRGLHPILKVWNVSWTGLLEDLRSSHHFLEEQVNTNSDFFQWLEPSSPEDGEPTRWWCPKFELKNVRGEAWVLTAQFVERP